MRRNVGAILAVAGMLVIGVSCLWMQYQMHSGQTGLAAAKMWFSIASYVGLAIVIVGVVAHARGRRAERMAR